MVEGNTTFYHTPDAQTVQSWKRALSDTDLLLSFKLPRTITHERRPDLQELTRFFQRIAPLGQHIGPVLLQFPARIAPRHLPMLDKLCEQLPQQYRYVLEMRHADFFATPELLEPLLDKFRFGRVVMDTRAIFHGNRQHPEVVSALHDKPNLPVVDQLHANTAFVRLMLHPDIVSNGPYLAQWAERTAAYIKAGVQTHMLIHCPNNLHCPPLAAQFHQQLRRCAGMQDLPALPPWPVPHQDQLFH